MVTPVRAPGSNPTSRSTAPEGAVGAGSSILCQPRPARREIGRARSAHRVKLLALPSSAMTSTLQERLRAVAKKVRVDFEESEHTKHHGSRGTEREEIVARFLELYVPGTVAVVHNAEVISMDGQVSKQCDIVIVDKRAPRLRDIKSHHIIPVECVYGVIEVKTRLTGSELVDACAKIATVKRLPRNAYTQDGWAPPPIFGQVFTFDSIRMENLNDRLLKWCMENPREIHPDGVWVGDSGMLVWGQSLAHRIAAQQFGILLSTILAWNVNCYS